MDPVIENDRPAPSFELLDLQNARHSLSDQLGRITVLHFWSAECPWAERADQALLSILQQWGDRLDIWWIASNANEPPGLLRQTAAERNLPLVLVDEQQTIADLYGAQTTPHLFVIDAAGILRYQGALDDVTFRRRRPSQFYLRDALRALLAGQVPENSQTQPYGCIIVRFA